MQQQQLYLQHYLYSSSNIRDVTQCSSSSYTYSSTYIAAVTSTMLLKCNNSYTYSITYTYGITYIAAVTSAMLLNTATAAILTTLLIHTALLILTAVLI